MKRTYVSAVMSAVLVASLLAGCGSKQESWKEGEDHIALELEFEQILCERAIRRTRPATRTSA